jgi:muramoyltetrapeptide carboxypeptidase LdcA involved in peptidoglycan recycling
MHSAAEGWMWRRTGKAAGPLVGGCLESLQHLRGTPYWPDMAGVILFIETSESCLSPQAADAMLMDYENMGVFGQIAGLLVARPYGMSLPQHSDFWQVVEERTRGYCFPVVGNMDFGHTSPQLTLPVGTMAEIDGEARTVAITEAAVSGR